ncbi:hypothetical protein [Nocardia noduli]|uniref:hypothetical protein n=1 Tax=Nocardia noduli TaxID=2815722 RepID=UPI001C21F544|nr:hypothetical protein [Nocardia noduli]
MTTPTPPQSQLQAVAAEVLAHARETGIRATVTSLAQYAGITRPTLYRNHPGLVQQFLADAAQSAAELSPRPSRSSSNDELRERNTRLREENRQLRLHLDHYEEHIRRLTIENTRLQAAVAGHVSDLSTHRHQRMINDIR